MKKKHILFIIINALCLVGVVVCQIVSSSITSKLLVGQAAKSWAGQSGERFAQFAVYFPPSYTFDDAARYQLRSKLNTTLQGASLESDENRRLYTDAWSAEGSVMVTGERGSADASVIGVGGDFFLFHPLQLRSGSYISQNDLMRDRVIVDEDLAWRLYGSVHLEGLEVLINNRPFLIAGVIARETDSASTAAYSGGAGMFMSYELLDAITGGGAHINSFEVVLPDPVTDFAKTALTDAFANESLSIVDNTARFSLSRIFDVIGSFGERSMRTNAVAYPYWENAARYAEDWAALLLFLSIVLLVCPAVFAVVYGVRLILLIIREIKDGVRAYLRRRDEREYRKYLEEREKMLKQIEN